MVEADVPWHTQQSVLQATPKYWLQGGHKTE